MVDCDNCGREAPEVWRHRNRSGTMTHRSVSWYCRDCHPSVPETVASTASRGVAMTDGGRAGMACPSCGGATVDGQGLLDCLNCTWSGRG